LKFKVQNSKFKIKTRKKMNVIQRLKAPTPKFFKVLRTVGLALAAAGATVVAAPIALPAAIVAAGGYLAVAGAVATAVAQSAVKQEEDGDEGLSPGGDDAS
jgi:hypothetical protein